jgi:hypothetical protein
MGDALITGFLDIPDGSGLATTFRRDVKKLASIIPYS